jgi:hypothetical protein
MPREKPSYRDNLERLNERFPNRELLNKSEVGDFLGIHRKTAAKWFSFNVHGMTSKATLARELS